MKLLHEQAKSIRVHLVEPLRAMRKQYHERTRGNEHAKNRLFFDFNEIDVIVAPRIRPSSDGIRKMFIPESTWKNEIKNVPKEHGVSGGTYAFIKVQYSLC